MNDDTKTFYWSARPEGPVQPHRTKKLSLKKQEALEQYRIRLFESKDKPILLEMVNTILETNNYIFAS